MALINIFTTTNCRTDRRVLQIERSIRKSAYNLAFGMQLFLINLAWFNPVLLHEAEAAGYQYFLPCCHHLRRMKRYVDENINEISTWTSLQASIFRQLVISIFHFFIMESYRKFCTELAICTRRKTNPFHHQWHQQRMAAASHVKRRLVGGKVVTMSTATINLRSTG